MADNQSPEVPSRKKKKSGRVCTECGQRPPPSRRRAICDDCIARIAEAVKARPPGL